jgi:hypothetical protein
MYICDLCHSVSNPKERANKVIVKKRNKIYKTINYKGIEKYFNGWEITKEIILCSKCFKKHEKDKECR